MASPTISNAAPRAMPAIPGGPCISRRRREPAAAAQSEPQWMTETMWASCRYCFMPSRLDPGPAVSLFHPLIGPQHPRLRMVSESDVRVVLFRRRSREEEELRVLPRERLGPPDELLPDPVLLMGLPHRQVGEIGHEAEVAQRARDADQEFVVPRRDD